ncbi:hypothetical protein ACQKJ1_28325 [Methylorubrum rhodesianum]|uniref:hypothetical protein n=1 Tax=Methylorubrum rhodesianum TaxID=29427 RepID=UPI003CFED922
MKSWASFEDRIRELATYIYQNECKPAHIGGVDVDGVIEIDEDTRVLIEITERKDLAKVREDIVKLTVAKHALYRENILAKCICVVNNGVTTSMIEAGKAENIKVLSAENFSRIFFDFDTYRSARENVAFGSAVNPITGRKDDSDYVEVTYIREDNGREVTIEDISNLVISGNKVVMLGEYGTGKSRCLRQLFKHISSKVKDTHTYPMALDLREAWGLKRGYELIRRHIEDLGLQQQLHGASIRALVSGSLVVLLDGFDELGSQSWSNDSDKLKVIRAKSLEGVRDLLHRAKSGIFVSGREHYFNNNDEMFSSLGIAADEAILIRCKDEFTEEETERFFKRMSADIAVPDWLPRRPLICQTISDLSSDELDQMFGVGEDELQFFDHFVSVLCKRDALINASFDASTIEKVLTHLARSTRSKTSNVGPITLSDVQRAFEAVVGELPVEEASSMLQRLPALGRVKAETNDRQFIDGYILDGLRAKDVVLTRRSGEVGLRTISSAVFINPIDDLGQRILHKDIYDNPRAYIQILKNPTGANNKVLACDIVAAALRGNGGQFDFQDITIDDGIFLKLDMSSMLPVRLNIQNTVFSTIILPSAPPPNTSIRNCLAERIYGVASRSALPSWIMNLDADRYDSVESVSRIKKIGLSANHEILAAIIRKTFFQKGSGRKEEALTRGLGQIGSTTLIDKTINLLLKENVLERFKGDEGWVYKPNRSYAGRMKKMLYELRVSQDEIWVAAGSL